MNHLFSAIAIFLFFSLSPALLNAKESAKQDSTVHHDLKVVLYPKEHRFSAEDTITIPEHFPSVFHFSLHSELAPVSTTPDVIISRGVAKKDDASVEFFTVKTSHGVKTFILKYSGVIHHPLEQDGNEEAHGIKQTPGIISDEGIYLEKESYWYPVFNKGLVTFNLHIELPPEWDAVSQGERTLHIKEKNLTRVQWNSPEPQDEIYLIAARFTEYTQQTGRVSAMAFLRTPDKELADKYLNATSQYITMYENLIGPYPYKKFALVENFYETGFGMPSFTLLGSKVIRLPFIITSSYPHEILHNWWGNSVFVDYNSGNWSEGLTAYLSDYLIMEQQGKGIEYRLTTLQKYADYVSTGKDFPLSEFRVRYSAPTESIGYGKSLLFFHMLRQKLGDKDFTAGLQNFYLKNKFEFASFTDIKKSFETASKRDLDIDFKQWVAQAGAPEIRLKDVKAATDKEGYLITGYIEQVQNGEAYHLQIPVAVTMENTERAFQTVLNMDKKKMKFSISAPSRPLRIDIDPEFDIFRRLDRAETPPAISQVLGAKELLIIIPSYAPHSLLQAYQEFAKALSNSNDNKTKVALDKEIKKLPSDQAVVILGWENIFLKEMISLLSKYDISISQAKDHSVVFSARDPKDKESALLFVASDTIEALPGLSRKLLHYHKYSYLTFKGREPENIAKGRWPVYDS
ncbi:MAG: peptidase M28, partial [Nitrospirae bacterium]|nr:peptidase M28 [Nitrospirota bacterium]